MLLKARLALKRRLPHGLQAGVSSVCKKIRHMKTIVTRLQAPLFGLAALLALLTFTAATPLLPSQAESGPKLDALHRWERLGKRRVDYGLDRDEIFVTAREGRFAALKLVVRKAPIHLHRAVVHFGNGERMEIHVRKRIAAGGETRAIDLPGGRRVVRKVVFWYDTSGLPRGKAVVELWGRR